MAFVIFAPLLLTLLACALICLHSIYQITADDRICMKEVMRTQHELSRLAKSLVQLNRLAGHLRKQKRAADTQLAAAMVSGNPIAIAAAEANEKSVHIAQAALAAKQKSLLSFAGQIRFQSEQRIRASGLSDVDSGRDHALTLALRAEPPHSLTPDYVEASFFPERQSQTYSYKIHLFKFLPDWLKQYVSRHPDLADITQPMSRSCSATLLHQEENWKPILKKVNPSWNL